MTIVSRNMSGVVGVESLRPAGGGVRFTEEMRGWLGFAEDDFRAGSEAGRRDGHELMFHLTIEMDPVATLASSAERAGTPRGWVGCHALGGRLPVQWGWFNLIVDRGEPGVRNMLYRLWFTDGVGHPLTLSGLKVMKAGTPLDVWPDTSTLYTRVLRGHVDEAGEAGAELVGSGVLRIRRRDFARQLTTFRAAEGPREVARFGVLFARELWPFYGRARRR